MTPPDPSKQLATQIKKIRAREASLLPEPTGFPECDGAVHTLIYSYLLWDAPSVQAHGAFKRLHESLVDYNELRVCLADELSLIIGERYPHSLERCERLRVGLQDLYQRAHAVTLAPLAEATKRETRQYLTSLEGIPSFVADRVFLLRFSGHAVPVDRRILGLLISNALIPADSGVDDAAAWLERHVRAADARDTYEALQMWSDEDGATPKEPPPVKPKPAAPAPALPTAAAGAAKRRPRKRVEEAEPKTAPSRAPKSRRKRSVAKD